MCAVTRFTAWTAHPFIANHYDIVIGYIHIFELKWKIHSEEKQCSTCILNIIIEIMLWLYSYGNNHVTFYANSAFILQICLLDDCQTNILFFIIWFDIKNHARIGNGKRVRGMWVRCKLILTYSEYSMHIFKFLLKMTSNKKHWKCQYAVCRGCNSAAMYCRWNKIIFYDFSTSISSYQRDYTPGTICYTIALLSVMHIIIFVNHLSIHLINKLLYI